MNTNLDNLDHPALTHYQAALKMDENCESCRMFHTPACYERKDYNKDPAPGDWCWGWRRRK